MDAEDNRRFTVMDCNTAVVSVEFPENVTAIGANAFFSCSSLVQMVIPDGVKSIGLDAFDNCTSLVSLTIPRNVTTFGSTPFSFCSNLTVYCYEGGAAHTYCKDYSVRYELISE